MSRMRACYQIPECSLSYTKIMQGERNSKTEKRSFFRLDIAEPKLILYKDTIIFILSPEKTSFLIRKPVLWHPPPYL